MIEPISPSGSVLDGSVRRLDPRARLLWMGRRSAIWIVAGAVGAIVALANGSGSAAIAVLVVTGVVVATAVGSAAWSYRCWRGNRLVIRSA